MMSYPDICIRYCKNFGSNDCPTSSLCMATTDKPYFKPKKQETWFEKWMWKRERKAICKANRYYCPDCIYHEFVFDGVTFRGNKCRLEEGKR